MTDRPSSRRTSDSSIAFDRVRFEDGSATERGPDRVTVEEPLEIRLRAGDDEIAVAVTMRTPGADEELALGFLFAERVLREGDEVRAIESPDDPWSAPGEPSNVIVVELAGGSLPDLARLERNFFATSACGVCGKAGIENLRLTGLRPPRGDFVADAALLASLPRQLAREQDLFAATGGLHAAALFTAGGDLLAVREDVGRHNALDKLVGWAFKAGRLPFDDSIVMVSGRSSFELVQKSLAAGAPMLCSVSAPSSLAIEMARELDLTLIGFLRGGSFNVYAGAGRVAGSEISKKVD